MVDLFHGPDDPADVIARIREVGPTRWEDVDPVIRSLGVAKLRLAGVYDDRQDGHFMLRTRIPGGRLEADQAEVIAGVARDFAVRPQDEEGPDRFLEITTRQDIQLHWIRFEALPEIWQRYESVGLETVQACGDTLRNVTSCPVDGLDPAALLEAQPVVGALTELSSFEPTLTAGLPRKFKVAVSGCPTDCVAARIHDLAFTPARRGVEIGFNVHAGGGLSDSPRLASQLDLFVVPERAVDVVRAALELFAELGDYEHKAVNRFRVLVHDLRPVGTAAEITRRLPFRPPPAGEDLSTWRFEDHLGVHADRHRSSWVGLCVPLGRLSWTEFAEVARLARKYGNGGLRLTQRQNVILTGVGEPDDLAREPLLERFSPSPDPFSRAVLACTSAPFCKFAVLDVKTRGAELIEHLQRSVPQDRWSELDGLRLHLSGCKASCAQVQLAQVGLRATMARDEHGYRAAFDVALGGDIGAGRLARWTALEVPVDQVFHWLGEALPAGLAGPEASMNDLDAESREGRDD
ncbi:MAG: nitrite/sulfite reductase [Chloroflexota bacterium]